MMESNNYFENLRLKEEHNNKIFSAIKVLFENECENILQSLYSKGFRQINASELEKCGFNLMELVKSNSTHSNVLLGKITYYSENHFVGFDLKLRDNISNYFEIINTNNSKDKVEQLNIIRAKKKELESYENTASSFLEDFECRDLEQNKYYKELARKVRTQIIELENDLKYIV